jgi:hypothetical protein
MRAREIREKLDTHFFKSGRKLDLTKHRDLWRYEASIDREFEKLEAIIANVEKVLKGYSVYDKTQYKTILDSNRIKK